MSKLTQGLNRGAKAVYGLGSAFFVFLFFVPFGLLSNKHVRRLLLLIAVLNIPVTIDTHLMHRPDVEFMDSVSGLNVSLTTLSLLGLYLPLGFLDRRGGPAATVRESHFNKPLFIYLVFTVLSLAAARDPVLGLYEVFLFVQLFLLYHYVANYVDSPREILLVAGALVAGVALEGVLIVASAAGMKPIPLPGLRAYVQTVEFLDVLRYSGTLRSPNQAAAYITMGMAFALGVFLARLPRLWKVMALSAACFGALGLVLTFSRGGWLSFGIAFLAMLTLASKRDPAIRKAAFGMLACLAVVVVILFGSIQSRLHSEDRGAAYSRVPLNKMAGMLIEDSPLIGIGANNFGTAVQHHITKGFRGEFLSAVHNRWLLIWSETGIGALVAYLVFLAGALRRGWRCWQAGDQVFSPLALGCTAAILAQMFHMNSEAFRGRIVLQMLWILAALLVPLQRLCGATALRQQLAKAPEFLVPAGDWRRPSHARGRWS